MEPYSIKIRSRCLVLIGPIDICPVSTLTQRYGSTKACLVAEISILGENMQFSRSKFPKIPQSWLDMRLFYANSILVLWEKVGRSWGIALFLVYLTPWTWPKWRFRPFLGTMGWLNCLWRAESNFFCQKLLDTPHPAYKQAIRHSNSKKLKNS